MSSILKKDHPELNRRVWVKVTLHVALGLSLIFSPPLPTPQTTVTVVIHAIGLRVAGSIFLTIGILLAIGARRKANNYKMVRMMLAVATGHAMMWLLALILTVLTGDLRSATTLVLWSYLTYNLFHVTTEPGWETIQILDTIKDTDDGGK